ncbi:uncharacterized protein L969DRAFT_84208 [Mixia osmundae IAM 14324]|nr:uncharacterized protein L969DRAFT_84208 [Mixia osmundae IAM 14324]KEI42354.1 hypothetical protein L969DRAFT_84208 [Mixia osmundae IAM 14324]
MSTRLVSYLSKTSGRIAVGRLSSDGNSVCPVTDSCGKHYSDFYQLIDEWNTKLVQGKALGEGTPVEQVNDIKVLAPLRDRDVLAVGKNYKAHAAEFQKSGYDSSDRNEQPSHPVIFTKRASSIIANGEPIYPHTELSATLDFEGELGVIVGQGGRDIARADALKHVFGYVIINDMTHRDMQRDHKQFFLGKSLDTFCPMGPFVVPATEIDATKLTLTTYINGEKRQDQLTGELIFDIPTLIESCSKGLTLQSGDIIASGTPAGVGIGRSPPVFLKPGDMIDVSITGLGTLSNRVGEASMAPPRIDTLATSLKLTSSPPDNNVIALASGKSLHVETTGSGPALLFLHGLGGSSHFWTTVIDQSALSSSHTIITYDFDGHGQSPFSGNTLSVTELAQDAMEVLAALKISTATIIGHSLGGLVATTFASTYPKAVNKLILVGAVKAIPEAAAANTMNRARTVNNAGMSDVAAAVAEAATSKKTKNGGRLAYNYIKTLVASTNAPAYASACVALATAQDPNYAQIQADTLILSGAEDPISPKATTDFLANAIKNSHVVVLPDVAHWHALEDSAGTASHIADFVQ